MLNDKQKETSASPGHLRPKRFSFAISNTVNSLFPLSIPAIWNRVQHWWQEEDEYGHLDFLAPAAFLLGVLVYFVAPSEPSPFLVFAILIAFAGFVWTRYHRSQGELWPIVVLALITGFFTGSFHASYFSVTILERSLTTELEGTVELAEIRGSRVRLYLSVDQANASATIAFPQKVQVSVPKPKGKSYKPGDTVSGLFRLSPPTGPIHENGMDFRRYFYFRQIGAIGFSYGHPDHVSAVGNVSLRRAQSQLRLAVSERIDRVLEQQNAGVVRALIVGDRGGIDDEVLESLRKTGLAHLLAISGMHMAIFAGLAYYFVRSLFALSPHLALNHPIKKFAAFSALCIALFYLLLSGASVSTQRAFVMAALFFCAVVLGREALTLRTLAIAAIVVLVIHPYAILSPGYQMSFMAALWLIAVYQTSQQRYSEERSQDIPIWLSPIRLFKPVFLILLTSLIAGIATLPFSLYHFSNAAPLGLIANLLAMPVFSFLTMPFALLSLLAMPFGFEVIFLVPLGWSVSIILGIADFLANVSPTLPYLGQIKGELLLLTAIGMWVFGILRTPLKWCGGAIFVVGLACAITFTVAPPELVITADAKTLAVKYDEENISYTLVQTKRDAFVADQLDTFLPIEQPSAPEDGVKDGADECDKNLCALHLKNGHTIALIKERRALRSACQFATLIIWPFWSEPQCEDPAIIVVSRKQLDESGASAYRFAKPQERTKPNSATPGSSALLGADETYSSLPQDPKKLPRLELVWTSADEQGYRPWSLHSASR